MIVKRFDELFSIQNGMITPRVTIQFNGMTFGPGLSFGRGISFGGIDLSRHVGKQFNIDVMNGIYIIKGIAA